MFAIFYTLCDYYSVWTSHFKYTVLDNLNMSVAFREKVIIAERIVLTIMKTILQILFIKVREEKCYKNAKLHNILQLKWLIMSSNCIQSSDFSVEWGVFFWCT